MKIFELHFNPKLKEDLFFDSFVYEPSNAYERKLGFLYEVGELKNALPQNSKLLDNLAKAIREKYFTLSNKNPEKSVSESLKRANEFLSQELKKENVSWLGNLNFAVLSLKDFNLVFTKTGDIKVLMIRGGIITNIGKSFDIEKIDPYPLKVFFNIVSGKLAPNDIILVLTKEIYEYLNQRKILEKLARAGDIDKRKIKEIFPEEVFSSKKKEEQKAPGICFMILLEKESFSNKKSRNVFSPKREEFNFKQIFYPVKRPLNAVKRKIKKLIPAFLVFKNKIQPEKKEKKEIKIKPASSIVSTESIKKSNLKKKLMPILILAVLLVMGFLIFQNRKTTIKNDNVRETEELVKKEASSNLNKIEAPNLFYELKLNDPDFKAQKISFSDENLFFYNPNSQSIYKLNFREERLEPTKIDKFCSLAVSSSGSLFCFSDPDIISILKDGKLQEKTINFILSPKISQMALYYSNLYLLNFKDCQIIKVNLNNISGVPYNWLKQGFKNSCSQIKSIAVDGSLRVLNGDNSIDVYFKGEYQKTIKPDIYPAPENITKIETKAGVPYLYLLEPKNKRIIILDKEGKIFKQFQSEKFDSLTDFDISDDGKTIYLLNGNKIYSIEI